MCIGTDRSRWQLYSAGLLNGAKRKTKTCNIFFRRKKRLRGGDNIECVGAGEGANAESYVCTESPTAIDKAHRGKGRPAAQRTKRGRVELL
jgi:hypothetical protein